MRIRPLQFGMKRRIKPASMKHSCIDIAEHVIGQQLQVFQALHPVSTVDDVHHFARELRPPHQQVGHPVLHMHPRNAWSSVWKPAMTKLRGVRLR